MTAVRTALVTGAASGLGALAARRLAAAGWDVVAVDLDTGGLAETARRSPNTHVRVCDVGDAEAVNALVAGVGPVHRVVHAAAIGPLVPALEQPLEDVENVLRTDFLGTVHVVRATMPGMLERGGGELVLFSSLASLLPVPKTSAYAAAKAAVNVYAEALAAEHAGSGVVIRCVCPRQVDTPGFRAAAADDPAATGRMRGVPPGLVLDAVDRSLARPARDLYVFPDPLTRVVALARRWAPGTVRRLVGQVTSSR
ncbi:SDR family NAD(P)-dependent oxidoreductase [Actinomadura rupiterrae]|uniref:SDR family NAD(P)-dependent oxidoreductase n=1 Tax=Actinomadura rupiterrae TaxID=559627 RepID=UPI0020A3F144|nr:SDR family oxidoreductase [Actinomadura rupiterrae]MCP2335362.1 NAD(P)-dependent dehydrogenase (short-subunit alcohol dehydrogenase family) [Actinomadura rupiterrae]